jgi:ABC-type transporter MlaC component
VTALLKQLVEINYKNTLTKSLDYEMRILGTAGVEPAPTVKVRTEAKSKSKPRDPVILVDYIVICKGGNCQDVDMVTEGSMMSKNYYDQFRRMMSNPAQGYPYIVQQLNKNIAKKRAQNGG